MPAVPAENGQPDRGGDQREAGAQQERSPGRRGRNFERGFGTQLHATSAAEDPIAVLLPRTCGRADRHRPTRPSLAAMGARGRYLWSVPRIAPVAGSPTSTFT